MMAFLCKQKNYARNTIDKTTINEREEEKRSDADIGSGKKHSTKSPRVRFFEKGVPQSSPISEKHLPFFTSSFSSSPSSSFFPFFLPFFLFFMFMLWHFLLLY